jgi:ferritin
MKQKIYISEAGNELKSKSHANIDSFIHEFADVISRSNGFEEIYVDFNKWHVSDQIEEINKLKGLGIIVLFEGEKIAELLKKYQLWWEDD